MCKYKLLFMIFLVLACNPITQNKEKDQNQEFNNSIDFSKVDAYPKFPNCKELLEKNKEATCFSKKLNSFLDKTLINHSGFLRKTNADKINLYLSINRIGRLKIDSIKWNNKLQTNNNKLIDSINKKASTLNIQPALKRGIPVKVNFKMPVNIKVED